MDVPRKNAKRNRRIRRAIYGALGAIAVASITVGVSRLKPAVPEIDDKTVFKDTVRRGSMLRQVRGLGTLVPVDIRWIPAVTEGRVERRLVEPGTSVQSGTVLLELSNPQVEQAAAEAQWQVKGAEEEYKNLQVQLERELLDQRAGATTVQANYNQAKLQADKNEELAKQGLISMISYELSRMIADELFSRNKLEQERLNKFSEAMAAQLNVQRARVQQLRDLYALRLSQVDSLRVRAGIDGVLQQVPVEIGQQVTPGTNLARVARPDELKAALKIAETQAKDIQVGQRASIDTRNGIIAGYVMRIDPAVREGFVTVDAALEGELPKGARPDLSVDGTIELERLEDILYIGRPVHGQEHSTISLFKLDGKGYADRTQIKLGRSSVNYIEVVSGLNEGEVVILSDMGSWDNVDRIRLR